MNAPTLEQTASGHRSAAEILPIAREFVHDHLSHARAGEYARRYRFEHCLRVARIGREVALKEGLDPDLLELGCLLHDVGKYDAQVPVDHGRAGALIALDFLLDAGLDQSLATELAQGIAMHTDGQWNARNDDHGTPYNAVGREYLRFDGEPTVLAQSIGDCDNIDRFSLYRVADTLRYVRFMEKSTQLQRAWLEENLEHLRFQYEYQCATQSAQDRWVKALDRQIEFYRQLNAELG
ncbi:HD domain-containing protein [Arcanobacterium canis]